MSSSDSFAAIAFWELIAEAGFLLVILGVMLEGSELLVKLGRKKRFRKRLNEVIRRRLVATVKFLRPRILPFETVGFLVLVFGLGVEFIGNRFATRLQGNENAKLKNRASQLEKDDAIANQRASLTESNNLMLRSKVRNLQLKARARFWGFDASVFKNALKGKPMAKVELLYQKDDLESYDFAAKIKLALNDAGWMTIGLRPILGSDALYPASPPVQKPLIVRAGGGLAGGIGLISKNPPEMTKIESPADALMNALSLAGLKNGHPAQKTFLRTVDPRLSDDDLLKLVIGLNYSGPLLDE